MISISDRALKTPASAIRKLIPFADEAKKKGIKVYHLNIGQPDLDTPSEILESIHKFRNKTVEYAPSAGIKEVNIAWAKFYQDKGFSYSEKDIIVTSGGSEALIFAFLAACDEGDELLVFEPFYTSYSIIASMTGVRLKGVNTRQEDGFHLPSKEAIEKNIGKNTKGIIVCNPNNPTGTLYSEKEVRMIAQIAKTRGLFIISDETYQEIIFDGEKVLPFALIKNLEKNLIIVDSVSKRFNACGLRVGCIASKNSELMASVLRFAQGRLSVATVEQLSVVKNLSKHKSYVSKIREIYQKRRNTVVKELKKIQGVSLVVPKGAFYIMPKLPITDSDHFAEFLLKDFSYKGQTTMVAPASGFYSKAGKGKDEIRIAYVLKEEDLVKAINIINIALQSYRRH